MRLDEWQKFIESQFLDEQPLPPKTVPAAGVKSEVQPALPLEDPIAGETDIPAAEAGGKSPVRTSREDTTPAEQQDDLPTSMAVVKPKFQSPGFVVRSSALLPEESVIELPPVAPLLFGAAQEIDTDIPDFASYLSSKITAAGRDEVAMTISEVCPSPADMPTESGQVSVLMPLTSGFVSVPSAKPVESRNHSEESTPIRRRSRAPQARNVAPEPVPDRLASFDLWSKVPRHVQTLLALERMEEEREVAQASYKRPFQEKRAELIARILDPILSLEDTARLLNVCPTTVRRYTNKGILTYYRKETERPSDTGAERETRQRRFRLSDILAFLETQQSALEQDRKKERVVPSRRKRSGEDAADHSTSL